MNKFLARAAIGIAVLVLSLAAGCGEGLWQTTTSSSIDARILVTGQNGGPLSGAKVVSQAQPEGQLKLTGLTGADGKVTFLNIEPGLYTLNISRFDYNPVEITREISASDHDFTATLKASVTPPATSNPIIVTFSQLIDQPASFNNQLVTVEAYFFTGFEISALSAELTSLCSSPRVIPTQPLIWITGDLGQAVYENLMHQSDTPSGYPESFGHVRVTGTFQYGGKYGHLDAYSYMITVTGATILP